MRTEYFAIGRFENFSAATRFARSEATVRACSCMVRRAAPRHFDVFAYQAPPIKDLCRLAVNADLIEEGTHLKVLMQLCLDGGLSPAGWTFVSRHGLRAFEAAMQPTINHGAKFSNALRLIEWQARADLPEPLPRELAERFVASMGVLIREEHKFDPRLARAAFEHWAQIDELSRKRFADQEWLGVLVWMRDHDAQLDKNQWRAGWSAILRQYQRWACRLPKPADWESPLGDITIGRWRVQSLDSALKLAQEGSAMKHCLASYTDRCRTGEYRAFSVKALGSKDPLATIGIELNDGEWKLDQVKGKCNSDPERAILRVAQSVCECYQSVVNAVETRPESEQVLFCMAS